MKRIHKEQVYDEDLGMAVEFAQIAYPGYSMKIKSVVPEDPNCYVKYLILEKIIICICKTCKKEYEPRTIPKDSKEFCSFICALKFVYPYLF